MSEMAHMASVFAQVKQAVLDSGEVVSSRDYERLAKCCAKMVEILETCAVRIEGARDFSFARDVRIYLNIVKAMLDEPFFAHADFKMKEAAAEKERLSAEWQAYVDSVKARMPNVKPRKRTGPVSKYTAEERKQRKRDYQREYQKKLRARIRDEKQQTFSVDGVAGKWMKPSEALKQIAEAKRQHARKQAMTAVIRAKLNAVSKAAKTTRQRKGKKK